MTRSRGAARPRSPRAEIQAISIELAEVECSDYDAWQRRAAAAGGPIEPLIQFATWYPPVVENLMARRVTERLGSRRLPVWSRRHISANA